MEEEEEEEEVKKEEEEEDSKSHIKATFISVMNRTYTHCFQSLCH